MKTRVNFVWTAVVCALALMASPFAVQADIVVFNLTTEFSGAADPAGTPPWLRVTIDDENTPGSVKINMEATNLTGGEFVTEWDLNFDDSLDVTLLSFSAPVKTGTFMDPVISKSMNAFKADGDGKYDIEILFDNAPPADRFGAGDAALFTVTSSEAITAHSFDFLSFPDGGHGPFPVAAHVQGIGDDSGWITVPEPASLGLLAIGALALIRRR